MNAEKARTKNCGMDRIIFRAQFQILHLRLPNRIANLFSHPEALFILSSILGLFQPDDGAN